MAVLSAFQARHRALAEQMANEHGDADGASRGPRAPVGGDLRAGGAGPGGRDACGADIGPADVALLLSGGGPRHRASPATCSTCLRDRYVRIILDGLRPWRASGLPGEPLDFDRLQHLKQRAQRTATH